MVQLWDAGNAAMARDHQGFYRVEWDEYASGHFPQIHNQHAFSPRKHLWREVDKDLVCDGHAQALAGLAFLSRFETERLDNCETKDSPIDSQR